MKFEIFVFCYFNNFCSGAPVWKKEGLDKNHHEKYLFYHKFTVLTQHQYKWVFGNSPSQPGHYIYSKAFLSANESMCPNPNTGWSFNQGTADHRDWVQADLDIICIDSLNTSGNSGCKEYNMTQN